jgi:hypothetical protein
LGEIDVTLEEGQAAMITVAVSGSTEVPEELISYFVDIFRILTD